MPFSGDSVSSYRKGNDPFPLAQSKNVIIKKSQNLELEDPLGPLSTDKTL